MYFDFCMKFRFSCMLYLLGLNYMYIGAERIVFLHQEHLYINLWLE